MRGGSENSELELHPVPFHASVRTLGLKAIVDAERLAEA